MRMPVNDLAATEHLQPPSLDITPLEKAAAEF